MSHTYCGQLHKYHFNSDFSGEMVISEYIIGSGGESREVARIQAQDVIDLVATEYVLPKRIDKLEQMESVDEIFDI